MGGSGLTTSGFSSRPAPAARWARGGWATRKPMLEPGRADVRIQNWRLSSWLYLSVSSSVTRARRTVLAGCQGALKEALMPASGFCTTRRRAAPSS